MKNTGLALRWLVGVSFLYPAGAQASEPREMSVPRSVLARVKSFEPSAAVYLADLDRYLIACDDTDEEKSALLFLMSRDGQVENEPVEMEGLAKMTDMESMSQDGSTLYVLSSQELNKKGKDKPERNLFVRARRDGRRVSVTDKVLLRPLLLRALERSQEPALSAMRGRYQQELNIEAHFVRDGQLFVGLKDPQPRPGTALILNLGPVDSVLAGRIQDPRVWQEIQFSGGTRPVPPGDDEEEDGEEDDGEDEDNGEEDEESDEEEDDFQTAKKDKKDKKKKKDKKDKKKKDKKKDKKGKDKEKDQTGAERLTDMAFDSGQLLLATATSSESSSFWKWNTVTASMAEHHTGFRKKLEGFALNPSDGTVLGTFDQGEEAPLFSHFRR